MSTKDFFLKICNSSFGYLAEGVGANGLSGLSTKKRTFYAASLKQLKPRFWVDAVHELVQEMHGTPAM